MNVIHSRYTFRIFQSSSDSFQSLNFDGFCDRIELLGLLYHMNTNDGNDVWYYVPNKCRIEMWNIETTLRLWIPIFSLSLKSSWNKYVKACVLPYEYFCNKPVRLFIYFFFNWASLDKGKNHWDLFPNNQIVHMTMIHVNFTVI